MIIPQNFTPQQTIRPEFPEINQFEHAIRKALLPAVFRCAFKSPVFPIRNQLITFSRATMQQAP